MMAENEEPFDDGLDAMIEERTAKRNAPKDVAEPRQPKDRRAGDAPAWAQRLQASLDQMNANQGGSSNEDDDDDGILSIEELPDLEDFEEAGEKVKDAVTAPFREHALFRPWWGGGKKSDG